MYLFVYGTLKRGHHNHRLLDDAKLVGYAHIYGYKMVHLGGFPGVIKTPDGTGQVEGEVYEVDDFTRLDRLEGYNATRDTGMYVRRETQAHFISNAGDREETCQVYVWNETTKGRDIIEDGVWRR